MLRYKFLTYKQKEGQSFDEFMTELKNYPMTRFGELKNYLMKGKLITKKNQKFLDKSIYFWLAFESYCFHGHA